MTRFKINLVQELTRAIREERKVEIETTMVPSPLPNVLYWSEEPSKLDPVNKEYFQEAILQNVQYGMKARKQMAMTTVDLLDFDVFPYKCRGAKRCTNETCQAAISWQTTAARKEKCSACDRNMMQVLPCEVVFYHLVQRHADEPIQALYSTGRHSHGALVPHKIPIWFTREIEKLARTTDIVPSDVHAGRMTKFNFFAHCLALVDLDKIGRLINNARKNSIGIVHGGSSCPTDALTISKAMVAKNKRELQICKLVCVCAVCVLCAVCVCVCSCVCMGVCVCVWVQEWWLESLGLCVCVCVCWVFGIC